MARLITPMNTEYKIEFDAVSPVLRMIVGA